MARHWTILTFLLLLTLPSALYGRWIKDKVYLQTESVGKVEFSHYAHLEMESVGKDCTVCHNGVYHIVTRKNPAFSMADMQAGKACGFCHDGKQAFNVTGDCTTCHAGDILYVNEDAGNITFPHEAHLGMFGCDDCHPDPFKPERGANPANMEDMEKGQSCGSCHDGSTAFDVAEDCGACHAM
ncbi:MAG: cytochrome c3 family protein [Desulfuromonadales bacterium]